MGLDFDELKNQMPSRVYLLAVSLFDTMLCAWKWKAPACSVSPDSAAKSDRYLCSFRLGIGEDWDLGWGEDVLERSIQDLIDAIQP